MSHANDRARPMKDITNVDERAHHHHLIGGHAGGAKEHHHHDQGGAHSGTTADGIMPVMQMIDICSDSPLYSSPSFKRRRSRRLVAARSSRMSASKFVLPPD